jgi:hypothetical protein
LKTLKQQGQRFNLEFITPLPKTNSKYSWFYNYQQWRIWKMKSILEIDTCKFYKLNEAKTVLESCPNLKYGDRDHKIYFYEMWPLIRVVEFLNVNGENIDLLKFSDGERNDDGLVILNNKEREIQFVQAIDGQQERIRMEHLEKYGRAPGVQDMEWKGNKNKRILVNQDTNALETKAILRSLSNLIDVAIRGKIKLQYKGMWLGVVFDDYTPPLSEKTEPLYKEICERVLDKHVERIKKIYSRVFFIGTSGAYRSCYEI